MSWSDKVRKRNEHSEVEDPGLPVRMRRRRTVEDPDLPPSMRKGSSEDASKVLVVLVVIVVVVIFGQIVLHWVRTGVGGMFMTVAAILAALIYAKLNTNAHRSKSRKKLRGEPEPDSVQWEDPPKKHDR